jgi:hypothetical protein
MIKLKKNFYNIKGFKKILLIKRIWIKIEHKISLFLIKGWD